eukprot:726803-Rhodomonas_salina.4
MLLPGSRNAPVGGPPGRLLRAPSAMPSTELHDATVLNCTRSSSRPPIYPSSSSTATCTSITCSSTEIRCARHTLLPHLPAAHEAKKKKHLTVPCGVTCRSRASLTLSSRRRTGAPWSLLSASRRCPRP